jgi:putative transferase (TIGR04331 family)
MYKTFFDNLNDNLIKNIYYRAYPKERIIGWSFFEKEMLLADKIKRFKKFDSANTESKKIMLKSELVIVDYISASYLEALVMNIPTVVLFDKNSYFLKKKYKDIFYDLERVGIFQPEPIAAAKFINMVSEDVNKWWLSESTQVARKIFLNANLKDGNNIFNILSEYSKK